jgi:DNA-binding MarR family transcriptional regulator
MINQHLVDSYEVINQAYYYNYEYYFLVSIHQTIPKGLFLQDVVVLLTIDQMKKKKNNTSKQLATELHMSPSSFSNYLRTLESYDLIDRQRGLANRKLMFVELSATGVALMKQVKSEVLGYAKTLVRSFGLVNTIRYVNALLKVTHDNEDEPARTISLGSPIKTMQTVMDAILWIQINLSHNEMTHYETLSPSMSSKELRLMYEIHRLSMIQDVTPSGLSRSLGFAMSTVTSMMNGLEKKQLIHRTTSNTDLRKILVTLQPSAYPLLESFMTYRLATVDHIRRRLNVEEEGMIRESLQILKTYSRIT